MMWHVQYSKDATDRIERHSSPERVIEAACRLIDDGCDVYGVGTGPLTESIDRKEIARIYAMWARANCRSKFQPHYPQPDQHLVVSSREVKATPASIRGRRARPVCKYKTRSGHGVLEGERRDFIITIKHLS
jgi:hypothetical protein